MHLSLFTSAASLPHISPFYPPLKQSNPHFTVPRSLDRLVRGLVACVCQRDQSCHPSWWAAEGRSRSFHSAWTEPGSSAWVCLQVGREKVGRVSKRVTSILFYLLWQVGRYLLSGSLALPAGTRKATSAKGHSSRSLVSGLSGRSWTAAADCTVGTSFLWSCWRTSLPWSPGRMTCHGNRLALCQSLQEEREREETELSYLFLYWSCAYYFFHVGT